MSSRSDPDPTPAPAPGRRWQRVQAIFHAALDMTAEEWDGYLDDVASRDGADLAAEVCSLLDHHAASAGLEPPTRPIDRGGVLTNDGQPQHIGPYRIVEILGEGGMGTVYLGERDDGEISKRVAIKMMRRDLAHDEANLRFLRERQLLADLEHPSIAKLLDAGTTDDGQPFLVMDYVDGEPIDAYCRLRAMSWRAFVELTSSVCQAVHFAHRNLIVHRDLKPSNIFVRSNGMPVLLDFGIAKLLDDDASDAGPGLTRYGSGPRTPEYASPEQIEGGIITTATDVYLLGTVLFELLVGERPHQGQGRELERQICEHETPLVSQRLASLQQQGTDLLPLSRAFLAQPPRARGEIDSIVDKALSISPEARYLSADRLADDLGRHLDGRPVEARARTVGYLAGKFIRRHRQAVGIAAVVLALIGLFVASRVQQVRDLAIEAEKVQALNAFFLDTLGAADPYQGLGRSASVIDVLDAAAARIDETFHDQPVLAASARQALGSTYRRLGSYRPAERLLRRVVRQRRALGRQDLDMASSLLELGTLLETIGRLAEAGTLYEEAMVLVHQESAERSQLASDIRSWQSSLARIRGDIEAATRWRQEAIDIDRHRLGHARPGNLEALAILLTDQGDYSAAATAYEQAWRLMSTADDDKHPATTAYWSNLATLREQQGEHEGARELHERALADYQESLGEEHSEVALAHNKLGTFLIVQGEYDLAEKHLLAALAIYRQLWGNEHTRTAEVLDNLGVLFTNRGDHAEAYRHHQQALGIYQRVFSAKHPQIGVVLNNLAVIDYTSGDWQQGIERLREVVEIEREVYGEAHPRVIVGMTNLGATLGESGSSEEAESLLTEALDISLAAGRENHLDTADLRDLLGNLYQDLGRLEAAREQHQIGLDTRRQIVGDEHRLIVYSLNNLARVQYRIGDYEQAESLYRQALRIIEALPELDPSQQHNVHKNLAEVMCETPGRRSSAILTYDKALDGYEQTVGADHWLYLNGEASRADCLIKAGRRDEGVRALQRAAERLSAVAGPDHYTTLRASEQLAEWLRQS